jgi:hypothetical protein
VLNWRRLMVTLLGIVTVFRGARYLRSPKISTQPNPLRNY